MEEEQRPLLYFLEETPHLGNVFVYNNFLEEQELQLFEGTKSIERISENIWLYQKLTLFCTRINSETWMFDISGFRDAFIKVSHSQMIDWVNEVIQSSSISSTAKIVIIIPLEDCSFDFNFGKFLCEIKRGDMLLVPAYFWWKCTKGTFFINVLCGHHFR